MIRDKETKKIDAKKLVSFVGTLLMILSIFFVVQRLRATGGGDDGIDFALLTSPWIIAGLLFVATTEGLGILAAGLNFRALLRNVSGIAVDRILAVKVYTESNVYKYIPGGVMYVAGRNRLAVEVKALSHGKVVLSTILEGVAMVVGVIVVAVVFAFEHSVSYIRTLEIPTFVFVLLGLVLLSVIPTIYCLRHRIRSGIKKLTDNTETISWFVIVKRLGFSVLLMFLYSGTFLMTLMLMGQSMTFELGFAIIGLYLLSWLAGFMTPGAPSGLGIREAVMMMFLTGFVDDSILISAMVMHRVLTVMGDVFAYVIALLINIKSGKQKSKIKSCEA